MKVALTRRMLLAGIGTSVLLPSMANTQTGEWVSPRLEDLVGRPAAEEWGLIFKIRHLDQNEHITLNGQTYFDSSKTDSGYTSCAAIYRNDELLGLCRLSIEKQAHIDTFALKDTYQSDRAGQELLRFILGKIYDAQKQSLPTVMQAENRITIADNPTYGTLFETVVYPSRCQYAAPCIIAKTGTATPNYYAHQY